MNQLCPRRPDARKITKTVSSGLPTIPKATYLFPLRNRTKHVQAATRSSTFQTWVSRVEDQLTPGDCWIYFSLHRRTLYVRGLESFEEGILIVADEVEVCSSGSPM